MLQLNNCTFECRYYEKLSLPKGIIETLRVQLLELYGSQGTAKANISLIKKDMEAYLKKVDEQNKNLKFAKIQS